MLRASVFHDANYRFINFIVKAFKEFLADTFNNSLNLRVISVVLIIAFISVIRQSVIQFSWTASAKFMGEIFLHCCLSWNDCWLLFLFRLGFLDLNSLFDCRHSLWADGCCKFWYSFLKYYFADCAGWLLPGCSLSSAYLFD